jgi:exodeoxyribonuclease VII large subunit
MQQSSQRLDFAQRSLSTPRAPLAALDARAGALWRRASTAVQQAVAHRSLALGRQREVLFRLRIGTGRGAPGDRFARLASEVARRRHAAANRLATLEGQLRALDPHAVLKRGYAMAMTGDGRVVTDADSLHVDDALMLRFARGGAEVRVHALLHKESADDDTD